MKYHHFYVTPRAYICLAKHQLIVQIEIIDGVYNSQWYSVIRPFNQVATGKFFACQDMNWILNMPKFFVRSQGLCWIMLN